MEECGGAKPCGLTQFELRAVRYRKEQWAGLLASTLLALRECAAKQNAQRVRSEAGC